MYLETSLVLTLMVRTTIIIPLFSSDDELADYQLLSTGIK